MTAKQLLHPFKKDAFSNWRRTCVIQYGKYVWPQIIYTGSVQSDNVAAIGVVFEINLTNQNAIYWESANSHLKINGIPIFYIDSRHIQPQLYLEPPNTGVSDGIPTSKWPETFNSAFDRNDVYDLFQEKSVDSYETFRRATNPRGTRACDLDAIEIFENMLVGIEATEIWKVAPWKYFYKQFENVLQRRQGAYNLDAMMAQWIFISQHISSHPTKFIFVLHKLLWSGFRFDGQHTLSPCGSNGDYLSGYFKDANGSAVIDDEAICVFGELNKEVIQKLHQIQNNSFVRAHSLLKNVLIRQSIYDIYNELMHKREKI